MNSVTAMKAAILHDRVMWHCYKRCECGASVLEVLCDFVLSCAERLEMYYTTCFNRNVVKTIVLPCAEALIYIVMLARFCIAWPKARDKAWLVTHCKQIRTIGNSERVKKYPLFLFREISGLIFLNKCKSIHFFICLKKIFHLNT